MINNSTNININSHLKSLNAKKFMTYDVRNPGPGFGQAQKCGRVKLVNEIPTFSLLMIGSNIRYLFKGDHKRLVANYFYPLTDSCGGWGGLSD